ncbi:hypothetical protein NZK35_09280 [Stieleria sp. ICT_E10.1]|uniref:hypothetical protein n=1 Tax=Stieleria sedimenti TaxID=2976331 RepID=UPI00217F3408|nr:hypothetical protein [Stieleria sedimenti]MCS7466834.1 hypothetical protein [Stieleria sedimenti]
MTFKRINALQILLSAIVAAAMVLSALHWRDLSIRAAAGDGNAETVLESSSSPNLRRATHQPLLASPRADAALTNNRWQNQLNSGSEIQRVAHGEVSQFGGQSSDPNPVRLARLMPLDDTPVDAAANGNDSQVGTAVKTAAETFLKGAVLRFLSNDGTPLDPQPEGGSDKKYRLDRSHINHKVEFTFTPAWSQQVIESATIRIETKTGRTLGSSVSLLASQLKAKAMVFDLSSIANQGDIEISLAAVIDYKDSDGQLRQIEAKGNSCSITADSVGPIVDHVEVGGPVDAPNAFRLFLRDQDFEVAPGKLLKEAFTVYQLLDEGRATKVTIAEANISNETFGNRTTKVIVLTFANLPFGSYRLSVPYLSSDGVLVDGVQNPAGANGASGESRELIVDVYAKATQGERVEFPEFISTLEAAERKRRINPADKVETTVVRLYYFRDAHRVAQLINRTVEPHNRAAVEQAEIRAAKARKDADELTRQRRSAERKAVKDAEDLRRIENEIAAGRRDQAAIEAEKQQIYRTIQINNQRIATLKEQLNVSPTGGGGSGADGGTTPAPEPEGEVVYSETRPSPFRIASALIESPTATALPVTSATIDPNAKPGTIQAQINDLIRSNERLTARWNLLDSENDRLEDLTEALDGRRNTAFDSNEEALDLSEQEEIARADQFRLEVAAAHEDPDTYGAAKLDSVDPVAQVSISVIGEGLIQLRGPRKGINVIRTMINQIDAPVGQVKVDVITAQVNGENGARMEAPVGKIDAQLKISRGLTSQSLMLLRRAIQQEATLIATMHGTGHYQIDRDRRYLYEFFGRDFIDELYEMDSEFLNSENKILGLHSMDTISLHQALFVLALAKNDVRQRILANFMQMVRSDLIEAEFNMRRSAEVFPHKTRFWMPHHDRVNREEIAYEGIALNNNQRYHFTHLMNFFGSIQGGCVAGIDGFGIAGDSDTLNPVQREFIRLAQIFKSRLITELELKQRVIERTMIEDNVLNEIQEEEEARNSLRPRVLQLSREIQEQRLTASHDLATAQIDAEQWQDQIQQSLALGKQQAAEFLSKVETFIRSTEYDTLVDGDPKAVEMARQTRPLLAKVSHLADHASPRTQNLIKLKNLISKSDRVFELIEAGDASGIVSLIEMEENQFLADQLEDLIVKVTEESDEFWLAYNRLYREYIQAVNPLAFNYRTALDAYQELKRLERSLQNPDNHRELFGLVDSVHKTARGLAQVELQYSNAKEFLRQTRSSLEQKKLLDFLIQEQEEKLVDLLEGTRSRVAALDGYLKRLSVALEDDFQVQFYDPAFVRVRSASRHMDVTFAQVERTSILTNNRAFAKVSPQATMEFDLPKRKIAIVEALDGAKALAQDYGALLQDPTFLSAFQLMGGAPSNGMMQNVYPGLPSSGEQEQMGFAPLPDQQSGSALQSLVPDPSIYKIETGTGYEIRPVIQPDGISIVYDFNYMYTTNVREPVRADEKHLGRVKRHYINTQVQTTSFELRRVSRYQVALKAARTSQGVPLLQDIPGVGALFRPAPSAESSIQENIILAQSVVYPTVFDVMGLRWAPSVVDLNHLSVRDREHVVRGRKQLVTDSVFDETTRTVDEVLGLKRRGKEYDRPDLYHRQAQPSPYHPGGYVYPGVTPQDDPRGNGFLKRERRPSEFQDPPFDHRRRVPMNLEDASSTPVISNDAYESIDLGSMMESYQP